MKSKLKFFENIANRHFAKREKSFINLPDLYKKAYKANRDDLFSFSIMGEEEKEYRYDKVMELCEHFAVTMENKNDMNVALFWPKYLNKFMTPKLFDLIPNSWFIQEFGFCFACKHYKGPNKGAHKLIHSNKQKVIGIFGKCHKYKNTTKIHKDYKFLFKYNNHVMTHFRCRGWEPSKFYEQILKYRLLIILTDPDAEYNIAHFNNEQHNLNVFGFLNASDLEEDYYHYYD